MGTIKYKLKEIKKGELLLVNNLEELITIAKAVPYEDIPLYINASVNWVDEDGYLHSLEHAWNKEIKSKLNR